MWWWRRGAMLPWARHRGTCWWLLPCRTRPPGPEVGGRLADPASGPLVCPRPCPYHEALSQCLPNAPARSLSLERAVRFIAVHDHRSRAGSPGPQGPSDARAHHQRRHRFDHRGRIWRRQLQSHRSAGWGDLGGSPASFWLQGRHSGRRAGALAPALYGSDVGRTSHPGRADATGRAVCRQVLAAVLERSHQHFTALMEDERLTQCELDRRVQLFVDRFWQHYQSDLYLAALEILLATRQQADRGIDTAALVAQQSQSHLATMKRIFSDSPCSDEQYLAALILVHTFLTGLTIGRVFEHGRDSEECSLERVKALLQDMLRGEGC